MTMFFANSYRTLIGLTAAVALAIATSPALSHETGKSDSAEASITTELEVDYETLKEIETTETDSHAAETKVEEFTDGPDAEEITEARSCHKFLLLKVKNWPEFKVDMKRQCKRVFGRRVCVNVPQAYQRNCELQAFVEVCHPNAQALRRDIESCCKQAVAAGAITGIYTGNVSAATTALKGYLVACLQAKGVGQLNQLSVTIRTETKCGDWKPR